MAYKNMEAKRAYFAEYNKNRKAKREAKEKAGTEWNFVPLLEAWSGNVRPCNSAIIRPGIPA